MKSFLSQMFTAKAVAVVLTVCALTVFSAHAGECAVNPISFPPLPPPPHGWIEIWRFLFGIR